MVSASKRDAGTLFKGARLDHGEFRRIAREAFGIERPVSLRRSTASRNHGSHTSDAFDHRVMLNPHPLLHPTVESACRTLAHELWHLVQVESLPWRAYVAKHRAETRAYPYRERPREVEAREAEEAFWQELLPCVKIPNRSEAA